MLKTLSQCKSVFYSIVGMLGFLALISVKPVHAADYSVGSNYWVGYNTNYQNQNQWQNYWYGSTGNYTNAYMNVPSMNQTTNTSTMASTTSTNIYANNSFTYPRIVHGLPPQVRDGQDMYNVQTGQTVGVRVYAQSVTPQDFTTTICAQDSVGGYSIHLGCVPQAPFTNAANGPARFDFNVWPAMLGGQHHISFTYLDATGNWRPIQTPWYQNYNTSFSI